MIDVMLAEPNDSLSYAQYKMKSEEINEIKQEWNYYMQKSIDALNVGLYQYPYHFDLRIWKLILLNNWEHYDEFVSLIAETYDMKLENKEPFVWNIEESLDDKDVDFFYAMQRFQSWIVDEEKYSYFPQMLNINQKQIGRAHV